MRRWLGFIGSLAAAVLSLPVALALADLPGPTKHRVSTIVRRGAPGPTGPSSSPASRNPSKPPQRKTITNGPRKDIGVTVQVQPAEPLAFSMGQAFPNPSAGPTAIPFSLAAAALVTIKVYNITGQQVATLLHEVRGPGRASVTWDARDDQGRRCRPGLYFYKMNAGSFQRTRKITIR